VTYAAKKDAHLTLEKKTEYASIWCQYQVMQYPKGSTLNARKRRVCFRYDGGKVLVKLFSIGGCNIQVKTETKGAFGMEQSLA